MLLRGNKKDKVQGKTNLRLSSSSHHLIKLNQKVRDMNKSMSILELLLLPDPLAPPRDESCCCRWTTSSSLHLLLWLPLLPLPCEAGLQECPMQTEAGGGFFLCFFFFDCDNRGNTLILGMCPSFSLH